MKRLSIHVRERKTDSPWEGRGFRTQVGSWAVDRQEWSHPSPSNVKAGVEDGGHVFMEVWWQKVHTAFERRPRCQIQRSILCSLIWTLSSIQHHLLETLSFLGFNDTTLLVCWSSFPVFPPGLSFLIRRAPEVGPGLHFSQNAPLSSVSFVLITELLAGTDHPAKDCMYSPASLAARRGHVTTFWRCVKKCLRSPGCAFKGKDIFPSPPSPMAKMWTWQQELERP